jgi:hypothetical protein
VPADPDSERRTFWSTRRRRYNLALVASAVGAGVAFFATLVAWEFWPPPPGEFAHADFDMLSLVGGSVGAKIELLLRPRNPEAFRRRAFSLGLAFSVALPWIVPLNAWYEFMAVQMHR